MEEIINKICTNKIQCKKCGDVIESKDIYDLKYCSCKSVGIDGGHEYLKRLGNKDDYIELSNIKKSTKINLIDLRKKEIDLYKIKQLEILEELKRCVKEDCDFYLEHNECSIFLDYILNMQSELQKASNKK